MKKLIFNLIAMLFTGAIVQAQVTGSISGVVLDASQQPINGMAVFSFGIVNNEDPQDFQERIAGYRYSNQAGEFTYNYGGSVALLDTLAVGTFDCAGNFYHSSIVVNSNNQSDTVVIQLTGCTPTACDAALTVDSLALGSSQYMFEAISLRDSNSVLIGSAATPVIHEWSVNGNVLNNTIDPGPNMDTAVVARNQLPSNFQVCYRRTATCNQVCDTVGTLTPPTPFCTADFYVDTVNSVNFQGQIVVWENSTTSAGNIVDYLWDFGDGTTYNAQYPTHSYNDTGVYEVCLTVTAVDGSDTCVSTHCDSIGFDNNGNLVYKSGQQGFAINVVDPSTVGSLEHDLRSALSLYPNPSAGNATLKWGNSLKVYRIEVVSISGQVLRSIEPHGDHTQIEGLRQGAYLLRVSSDEGVTSLKMIVE